MHHPATCKKVFVGFIVAAHRIKWLFKQLAKRGQKTYLPEPSADTSHEPEQIAQRRLLSQRSNLRVLVRHLI